MTSLRLRLSAAVEAFSKPGDVQSTDPFAYAED
jgi:hypothetical protein